MVVTVQCPACWQATAVEIAGYQGLIEQYEDCQVCCRPMRIRAHLGDGAWGDGESEGEFAAEEPWIEVELDG